LCAFSDTAQLSAGQRPCEIEPPSFWRFSQFLLPPTLTTVFRSLCRGLAGQISCRLMPAMRIAAFVPLPLKSLLRRPYYAVRRRWMYAHPTPVRVVQEYWQKPDGINDPHKYLSGIARSKFLVDLLPGYVPKSASLLELSCNVRRNLNAAYQAGYRNLDGIEINPEAVEILKKTFLKGLPLPTSGSDASRTTSAPSSRDCIFTMAVLLYFHPSSDRIFAEMASRVKTLILVEAGKMRAGVTFRASITRYLSDSYAPESKINCDTIPELVE
jgi:hypothetical protein